ncbi:MAG: NAD(P)H-dependent glycerol-3-phosphate dehydrogenase [bacterium]
MMSAELRKVTVLGAGMWGRTIATLLAKNNIEISMWDILSDLTDELNQFFTQMKSNGHDFIVQPNFQSDLTESLNETDLVVIVLPSSVVRKVTTQLKNSIQKNCKVLIASKGIEESGDKFSLMSEVVKSELGDDYSIGVLSGPNLSLEIQARHPAVTLIASDDNSLIDTCMKLLASEMFRVYGSSDVIGVQIGGAVKNVIALAAGMVDELGFEYNTKAALLTRGLVEITRIGKKMGGDEKTFSGISGLGDLICTASSPTSRNYRAGRLFGSGKKREEIINEIGQVIEGISNSKTINKLSDKTKIEMPISKGVYRIVWEDESPLKAIKDLMNRDLKFE